MDIVFSHNHDKASKNSNETNRIRLTMLVTGSYKIPPSAPGNKIDRFRAVGH